MNKNSKKGIELIFSTLFPYKTSYFKKWKIYSYSLLSIFTDQLLTYVM